MRKQWEFCYSNFLFGDLTRNHKTLKYCIRIHFVFYEHRECFHLAMKPEYALWPHRVFAKPQQGNGRAGVEGPQELRLSNKGRRREEHSQVSADGHGHLITAPAGTEGHGWSCPHISDNTFPKQLTLAVNITAKWRESVQCGGSVSQAAACSPLGSWPEPGCSAYDAAPCHCFWKDSEGCPKDWALATLTGDLNGAPSLWLWPGPGPAFVTIWGVNHG